MRTFHLSFAKLGTITWRPGSSLLDPGELASKKLPNLRGGQLFAYLFRRFGYPNFGWDSDKNLASYLLSTPEKDVIFHVTPYMAGDCDTCRHDPIHVEIMFGCYVAKALEEEYEQEYMFKDRRGEWKDSEQGKRCIQALETAIGDLLRPVFVRDVPINCLGRIPDDIQGLPNPAPAFSGAGNAIPEALMADSDRYGQFYDAVISLGKGNFARGMQRVIALGQEKEG